MIDVYAELKRIVEALAENNIEYAVRGGWAMAIHGAPRATIDIDILISAESLDAVFRVAKTKNFRLKAEPMSFKDGRIEIRRISKIDEQTGFVLTLDCLLVTPELKEIWQTRMTVPLENGIVSVVSREGLIKLKTLSGRTQDLADIEKLAELEDES